MIGPADIILVNAQVLTLDPLKPRAAAVAINGDRILSVGTSGQLASFRTSTTLVIDCQGLPLVPGINDAHCHLLATASSLSGIDCSSAANGSIPELLDAIEARASDLPPNSWIRGYGLDPDALREKRYPTLMELDSVSRGHLVRLDHSSAHASLMNAPALEAAGIGADTPDPMEGVIDRDPVNGEPTGLLFEMGAYLREKLGHTRSAAEMETDISRLSEKLLGYGITSVQDAGPHNGTEQWDTFLSLKNRGIFAPRISMMAGARRLDEFAQAGLRWGWGDEGLRLGHAKIMLGLTTGSLYPAPRDLEALAQEGLDAGFPFAVHVIEQEALAAVLALPQLARHPAAWLPEKPQPALPGARPGNRIEHCAECPPQLLAKLGHFRPTVVTQPGFVYWRGDRYLERVEPTLLPHLYDTNGLLLNNVPLAFSSDSPVIDPSPWPGIYAAITRQTFSGNRLPTHPASEAPGNAGKAMDLVRALRASTHGGACAEGMGGKKGMIRAGMLADLALLTDPLDAGQPEKIPQTRSCLTIVGGQVKWKEGMPYR